MKHSLTAVCQAFADRLSHVLQHHPRQLTLVLAAALLGGGGGAYAVASLGPDASNLPVREVLEAVQPLRTEASPDAFAAQALRLYRSDISRSNDTAETLLQRLGIDDTGAAAFLRTDANTRQGVLGRAGRTVIAEADERGGLLRLSARWTPEDDGNFKRLVIERTPQGGFGSRVETAPLVASARLGSGVIRSSLFAATDDARIPDTVAMQIAEIFAGDIDFHRALRRGDRFSVVYEALEADGEPMRTGRVLSVEFVNSGKSFEALWFQEPGSKGGYYTLDGQSMRRAFLASPMEFSRVSSGFKMRFHPILQKWRAHLGVDYAAPTGTAVRAVGDGVVEFAGVQNGFGNVVFLKHRNNTTTVYAHLSRIGVRVGQNVAQGQNIGAVGATGWATGPHLHFEFRVNGAHRDPLTVARQSEAIPVSPGARPAFDKLAAAMRIQLSAAASVQQAAAQ
ncbi:MAG: M23 family metallopeptidase [Burkholderiaceae bacterium]|nr:M23 family metallopeptidase [Burkholderiaceae bacterium]